MSKTQTAISGFEGQGRGLKPRIVDGHHLEVRTD